MADRVVPMARLFHTISVFLSVSRFICKTSVSYTHLTLPTKA